MNDKNLKVLTTPINLDHEEELTNRSVNFYSRIRNNRLLKPVFDALIGFIYSNVWVPSTLKTRVLAVKESIYFQKIPKVPNAGKLESGLLVMHNGVKIAPGSYYGVRMHYVFSQTGGVHEPTEEFHFHNMLGTLGKNPTMLELGSYWAFYSLWFKKVSDNGKVYMLEPNAERMASGVENFRINDMEGQFLSGFAGEENAIADDGTRVYSLSGLFELFEILELDVLHADIQGAELGLINGATEILNKGLVKNVFLSTHSEDIHSGCIKSLEAANYIIKESMPVAESDSVDGFIYAVASSVSY